jgi:hypothetical protein
MGGMMGGEKTKTNADLEVEEEKPREMVDDTASITPDKMKLKTKINLIGNVRCCYSCET